MASSLAVRLPWAAKAARRPKNASTSLRRAPGPIGKAENLACYTPVMTGELCLELCSDDDVLAGLHNLVDRERSITAPLLAHLAEVEVRGLHLRAVFSSLFIYCTDVLNFSEDAAYQRIHAARAARRFPILLERIASGALHLAAVRLLVPHLTEANHRELLDAASNQTKRGVELLLAARFPRPYLLSRVCKRPAARAELAPV